MRKGIHDSVCLPDCLLIVVLSASVCAEKRIRDSIFEAFASDFESRVTERLQ
jgi:hypothetical protein